MRRFAPSFGLFVVALMPNVGNAQADQFPTPPPRVNAASASWHVDGQPVLFQGALYYPTAGRVFFDAPFFPLASPSAVRSPEHQARSVSTAGSVARRAPLFEVPPGKSHSVATIVQSVPAPQSNDGIWILYDGARWRSAGAAVQYVHERFTAVGAYHGFPVYRDNDGRGDEIYIAAVSGGALTPYRRNQ